MQIIECVNVERTSNPYKHWQSAKVQKFSYSALYLKYNIFLNSFLFYIIFHFYINIIKKFHFFTKSIVVRLTDEKAFHFSGIWMH